MTALRAPARTARQPLRLPHDAGDGEITPRTDGEQAAERAGVGVVLRTQVDEQIEGRCIDPLQRRRGDSRRTASSSHRCPVRSAVCGSPARRRAIRRPGDARGLIPVRALQHPLSHLFVQPRERAKRAPPRRGRPFRNLCRVRRGDESATRYREPWQRPGPRDDGPGERRTRSQRRTAPDQRRRGRQSERGCHCRSRW